jgi:ABC-type multidrug transport system ATPase subunit
MQLHAVLYSIPNSERKQRIKDLLTFVELWDRKDSLVKLFRGE